MGSGAREPVIMQFHSPQWKRARRIDSARWKERDGLFWMKTRVRRDAISQVRLQCNFQMIFLSKDVFVRSSAVAEITHSHV